MMISKAELGGESTKDSEGSLVELFHFSHSSWRKSLRFLLMMKHAVLLKAETCRL